MELNLGMTRMAEYPILRKKLGEQETVEFMEFVKSEVKSEMDMKSTAFLSKDDKLEIIDRINKSKTETIVWIVGTCVLQFLLFIFSKKFL